MSISTTINRWSYVGNGVTTAFAYTNKILASTDLKVYLETIADGTLTLQTETTHYTVSGAGEAAGGNVTFLTPPSSAYNVVIVREVPYTQPAEFDPRKQQSPSGTEDAFDRATILVQQVLDRLSRTIGLATGKSSPASLDGLTGDLASKYLGFDADEQPVALDAPADTTAVSAYMAALLLTASEAAFKAAANLEAGVDFLAYSTRVNNLDQDFVDVASATTTDIGAAASRNVRITGTTTITGLGTVAAGIARLVRFAGALTLTHNGTSLILPGGANIATAANDAARFVSLGSGNWICTRYQRAAGLGVAHPAFRATQASAQILTAATYVKIQFGTETYDTHAYYDNATNYRYTPLVAGKPGKPPPPIMPFMAPRRFIIFIMPPPCIFFIMSCICSNSLSRRLTSCT